MSELRIGDCRSIMREWIAAGVRAQMCVTSPPYWGLRDYGVEGQIGLERSPAEYVATMVEAFRLVRQVLADDGTLWLNLGDSYAGSGKGPSNDAPRPNGASMDNIGAAPNTWLPVPVGLKPKDLCGIPWRVAFALQADGWWLRSDIIWHKPNPMPESVTDRPTKSHEYLFLLAKSERYYYNAEVIKERATYAGKTITLGEQSLSKGQANGANVAKSGNAKADAVTVADGRNRRTVWTIATEPYHEAHFATFPQALVEPCILAGSRPGDTVLDPFMGSGTVAKVAQRLGRKYLGCELNPAYAGLQDDRTRETIGMPL